MRRISAVILILILILALSFFLFRSAPTQDAQLLSTDPSILATEPAPATEVQEHLSAHFVTIGGLDNDLWFTKYGNIHTDCESQLFLNEMGFAMGDTVKVSFSEQELILPVVPNYSYVDSGTPAVIVKLDDNGSPEGMVSLAINMGNFGETYGLAKKITDDSGQWHWEALEGIAFPVSVSFEMYDPGGYYAQYTLRSLARTNSREDYPHLSDAEFANFREISTSGIPGKRLYRTSSPINPELGRNTYACDLLEEMGVNVIMNLADNLEEAQSYEGYSSSYYAKQNVIYLNMGVDFTAPDFKTSLASGLQFFARNPGTYAVHCTEGKDRAGFVSALLECLMGAECQEVVDDYLVTYYNYYGVEFGSEKADLIAQSNIISILCDAFEITDPYQADLSAEAAEYIRTLGLSVAEIDQLRQNLSQ